MPSPFPGMDPYLEISGDWRDFHSRFLNGCADALADQLPENYVARIEEQFQILEFPEETEEHRLPDVSISRTAPSRPGSSTSVAAPTLEPEFIPLVTTIVEEVKERWIEIRRRPDWTPVTIIERSIDYSAPLDLPLSPKDRAWAQKRPRSHDDAEGR